MSWRLSHLGKSVNITRDVDGKFMIPHCPKTRSSQSPARRIGEIYHSSSIKEVRDYLYSGILENVEKEGLGVFLWILFEFLMPGNPRAVQSVVLNQHWVI